MHVATGDQLHEICTWIVGISADCMTILSISEHFRTSVICPEQINLVSETKFSLT